MQFFSLMVRFYALVIFLFASSADAANWGDRCRAGLKLLASRVDTLIHGSKEKQISKIRRYVNSKQDELREYLNPARAREKLAESRYPRSPDEQVLLNPDNLACRFCEGASHRLIDDLHIDFSPFRYQWQLLHTGGIGERLFSRFNHLLIYEPRLSLIVDPTYRQVLTYYGPNILEKLPAIFVGTADDFRALTRERLKQRDIETYLAIPHDMSSSKRRLIAFKFRDAKSGEEREVFEVFHPTIGGGWVSINPFNGSILYLLDANERDMTSVVNPDQ